MPISALVMTVSNDPSIQKIVLSQLQQHPMLNIGEPHGVHVPIVLETANATESECVVEDLLSYTGVEFIDVVSVDFSDQEFA